jgi:hypothetical protein
VALFLPEIWQVATAEQKILWRQVTGYRLERGLWIIASDR